MKVLATHPLRAITVFKPRHRHQEYQEVEAFLSREPNLNRFGPVASLSATTTRNASPPLQIATKERWRPLPICRPRTGRAWEKNPGAAPHNSSLNQIFTRKGLKSSRINPASTEVKPCVSP